MTLFVGIAGIGMRPSTVVASNEDGTLANWATGQPLSLHSTSMADFVKRLFDLLHYVGAPLGRALGDFGDARICVAATGIRFPYLAQQELPREIMHQKLPVSSITFLSDIEAAFVSHALTNTGTGLIAHTGASTLVMHDGVPFPYGGWGPAAAEEGSAYRIGLTVLRHVGRSFDDGVADSVLWDEVRQWLMNPGDYLPEWRDVSNRWKSIVAAFEEQGHDPRTALFRLAHDPGGPVDFRSITSGLIIPATKALGRGDRVTNDIFERAANSIAEQHQRACTQVGQRLGLPCERFLEPIVICGGGFTHNAEYRDMVQQHLRNNYGQDTRIVVTGAPGTLHPSVGALLLALGGSKPGMLRIPDRTILERVSTTCNVVHRKQ